MYICALALPYTEERLRMEKNPISSSPSHVIGFITHSSVQKGRLTKLLSAAVLFLPNIEVVPYNLTDANPFFPSLQHLFQRLTLSSPAQFCLGQVSSFQVIKKKKSFCIDIRYSGASNVFVSN